MELVMGEGLLLPIRLVGTIALLLILLLLGTIIVVPLTVTTRDMSDPVQKKSRNITKTIENNFAYSLGLPAPV
jgi:archaellum component FlaG (FlaF/FlaG flagellin family)